MEMQIVPKTRYVDSDLQKSKILILSKKDIAEEELATLTISLNHANPNGADDTGGTYKNLEDGKATLEKESIHQLAGRHKKFIEQLETKLRQN